MRFYLIGLGVCMGLSGCVNYAGMHASSTPYGTARLATRHDYHIPRPPSLTNQSDWWSRFHDAQLNQLIDVALADSPTIEIAKDRIQKSVQLANKAEAAIWPSIDLFAYRTRERFSKFGLVPPPFNGKTFNIADIGLNFNYEIDFWGKNREMLAARVNDACASVADYAAARLILSTAIASNYFQLQSNLAKQNLAKAMLKQRRRMLSIIRYRLKHGIQSAVPVKTAETDMQNIMLAVNQYQENAQLYRHRLAMLMGKNPLTTTIDMPRFHYHPYHVALPASLPSELIGQRPDMIAARARADAASHRVKVAKARFYPSVNLNLLFSYQTIFFNQLFNHESQNNAATGAIDLPIFDAGARRANLGIRYAEYDFAVNQYNQTILMALKEVADQLSIFKNLDAQLVSQQAAVTASKRNYELIQLRYEHGIVDYLPVLQKEGLLLQQQTMLLDYQARRLLAVVAMIKALGGDFTINKERYDFCHIT